MSKQFEVPYFNTDAQQRFNQAVKRYEQSIRKTKRSTRKK